MCWVHRHWDGFANLFQDELQVYRNTQAVD
jgi:hypothetical protein